MAVKGSTLFVGQYIFGGTAGAPLSVNTAGTGLAQGLPYTEASSTTAATITSSTAAAITTMTVTPAAGTYLVNFSGWFSQSAGGATITVSIYVGGTQKADSIRIIQPFSSAALAVNQDTCLSTNGIVTVNGSQAIAIYWATSGGTATVTNRTLDIVRVA